jgi:hypothetical protein
MQRERYKYNFADYKADERKPLPEDINGLIEDAVKPLGCVNLDSLLERIRERRMYGRVMVFDKRAVSIAEFKFQSGICSDFDIIENPEDPVLVRPLHAIFRRSEKNRVVSFQKKNT